MAYKRRKKKKSYSQKLIPVIILAVIVYTVAAFILQYHNGTEISPTLTTLYFGFWTAEIVNLAMIRTSKEKTTRESVTAINNITLSDDESVG